jgi:hypothetical protein
MHVQVIPKLARALEQPHKRCVAISPDSQDIAESLLVWAS